MSRPSLGLPPHLCNKGLGPGAPWVPGSSKVLNAHCLFSCRCVLALSWRGPVLLLSAIRILLVVQGQAQVAASVFFIQQVCINASSARCHPKSKGREVNGASILASGAKGHTWGSVSPAAEVSAGMVPRHSAPSLALPAPPSACLSASAGAL